MIIRNRYNVGDKVRVKTKYKNYKRREVEATITGVILEVNPNNVKYKIHIESDELEKKQGCFGYGGYIDEDNIIELCL